MNKKSGTGGCVRLQGLQIQEIWINMCGFDDLDQEILESVCLDYEPFEWVVKRVLARKCDQNESCSAEISDRLMEYVSRRLIEAYLIHAEPPFVTVIGARSEMVRNSWLFITPQGQRYLQDLRDRPIIM